MCLKVKKVLPESFWLRETLLQIQKSQRHNIQENKSILCFIDYFWGCTINQLLQKKSILFYGCHAEKVVCYGDKILWSQIFPRKYLNHLCMQWWYSSVSIFGRVEQSQIGKRWMFDWTLTFRLIWKEHDFIQLFFN